ncbi:MAG: ABC transporter permease [Bosea sp.]|nr:ABC transporter permease [Bosea sp. (in: a-proteobacteria)]
MEWLASLQRGLHADALAALKALPDAGLSGLPALLGAAFVFGLLHALLPGHGKTLLTARFAGSGKLSGALAASVIVIVTHVGMAIILVLSGAAILRKTLVGAGRAPALEQFSNGLIVAVGLWLLWRAMRPHQHETTGSGPMLAFVGGLVPCPLTTFIMSYAVMNGLVGAGLLLSGAFASGMIITVVAFPLLAVLFRARLVALLDRTDGWRRHAGFGLEIAAALAIVTLGAWPLLR